MNKQLIIGEYLYLILMQDCGLVYIAETYTKAGVIRVYKAPDGSYVSTTGHVIRQVAMDGDALARYLCHVAMDNKSAAFTAAFPT
jgi:hypothetical protein